MDLTVENSLTVIGIYLTFAGLLGSFFYIHVGEWFRDIQALKAAWSFCRVQSILPLQEEARRCDAEWHRLELRHILWTILPIAGFLLVLSFFAVSMYIFMDKPLAAWWYVMWAWIVFMVVFFGMSAYFVLRGRSELKDLRTDMDDTARLRDHSNEETAPAGHDGAQTGVQAPDLPEALP